MRGLFASPLGFLIGLSLGALGGGGSVLAVPALVYAAGEGPKAATTTSLLIVGTSALVGAFAHWRAGRVRIGAGLLFGLVGVGGSLLGSRLNTSVNPDVLLLAFSGLMMVVAWRMWSTSRSGPGHPERHRAVPRCSEGEQQNEDRSRVRAGSSVHSERHAPFAVSSSPRATPGRPMFSLRVVAEVIAAGTVVGLLTGFFGVGGGFVVVPALVLVLRYEMPVAVGTSLLVIAINSGVALLARLHGAGIEWHVALPFAIAALLGVGVGEKVAGRVRSVVLARSFVALLVAVALYTALRSTIAL